MLNQETLLLIGAYMALGGLYLLILPAATYYYLHQRWYVASSVERTLMYFGVFLFFPGMILLAPVLNFRPQRRELKA